jgi:hypothetical protein
MTPARRTVVNAWNRWDDWAKRIACPKCKARPGVRCAIRQTDTYEWPRGWQTHRDRLAAAGKAEVQKEMRSSENRDTE